ncbi:MAG: riboflavin synthase [Actinomycetota bacterium]|jgi:riboflavin synthase|nr:riboflavin synthase [Actinomycetota bacterium]
MFTGIVEALGEVMVREDLTDSARLQVRAPALDDLRHGDSLAVNGVCLTVAGLPGNGCFAADVMAETLHRSALAGLATGDRVNLERAVTAQSRLGGHIVQGHVDGVGTLVSRTPGQGWDVVRIGLPPDLSRYVVEKGSIAVDGISLTVSALSDVPATGATEQGGWFEVSLIPTTLEHTTLGFRQPGDAVNLEVDVIAKYVERLVDPALRS